MTELTVCKQLDELEEKLPPIAAGVVRVNRSVASRMLHETERFLSMASSSVASVASAADRSLRTVTGTAKWAAERTASTAATGARQTVGQAKAQSRIATEAVADELDDLADDLDPGPGPAPAAGDLETRSKAELYEQAQELDIDGRSKMTKAELVAAIRAN